jgi:hypothetical protein
MAITEEVEDKKVEVTFNRKDFLTLLKAGKKVLGVNELTALIKDGYLEINELDKEHLILVNAKFHVSYNEDNKYVKFECDKLKEIQDSKDRFITVNLNETKSKDKIPLYININEFNVILMSVQELSELIKASDILSCSIMKISNESIEFHQDRIKLIKEVRLYEKKQENAKIYLSCEILSRINEILKDFKDESIEIYFGRKDGREQPVLFRIKGSWKELEIYIAPRCEV